MDVQNVKQTVNAVSMHLGDKVRTLQFDMNAFAELETRFGSVQAAMTNLMKGRIADVRLILWAALIHEEVVIDDITGEPKSYNITPYQVGSWIKNPGMMNSIVMKLNEAMSVGMPDISELPPEVKAKLEADGIKLDDMKQITEQTKNA